MQATVAGKYFLEERFANFISAVSPIEMQFYGSNPTFSGSRNTVKTSF